MKQKISVITVTYNNESTIERFIDSVLTTSPVVQMIIVDNNSQDKTRQILKKYADKVTTILSEENLGFGKGCNLGANSATGDFLVFLNPDSRLLERGSIDMLAEVLQNHPNYGMIGPSIVNPKGVRQGSVRHVPTTFNAIKEYFMSQKGAYDFYIPAGNDLVAVDTIHGSCMMMRKSLFDQIGGFNPKYFMYYEELELAQKVRSLGYKVGYFPKVSVEHIVGVSGKGSNTSRFLQDSAKKYHGFFEYYLLQALFKIAGKLGKV
jgi:GT2 family glycosyltransferase